MQMLMLFGCLLFPVIQPIAIYLKAKGQAKTMPKDVELSFDDAGLHVTVGKEKESIGWKKAAGGKRAWHDDRFFRCKTWIYAYKPYFGSTERTIFAFAKKGSQRRISVCGLADQTAKWRKKQDGTNSLKKRIKSGGRSLPFKRK